MYKIYAVPVSHIVSTFYLFLSKLHEVLYATGSDASMYDTHSGEVGLLLHSSLASLFN